MKFKKYSEYGEVFKDYERSINDIQANTCISEEEKLINKIEETRRFLKRYVDVNRALRYYSAKTEAAVKTLGATGVSIDTCISRLCKKNILNNDANEAFAAILNALTKSNGYFAFLLAAQVYNYSGMEFFYGLTEEEFPMVINLVINNNMFTSETERYKAVDCCSWSANSLDGNITVKTIVSDELSDVIIDCFSDGMLRDDIYSLLTDEMSVRAYTDKFISVIERLEPALFNICTLAIEDHADKADFAARSIYDYSITMLLLKMKSLYLIEYEEALVSRLNEYFIKRLHYILQITERVLDERVFAINVTYEEYMELFNSASFNEIREELADIISVVNSKNILSLVSTYILVKKILCNKECAEVLDKIDVDFSELFMLFKASANAGRFKYNFEKSEYFDIFRLRATIKKLYTVILDPYQFWYRYIYKVSGAPAELGLLTHDQARLIYNISNKCALQTLSNWDGVEYMPTFIEYSKWVALQMTLDIYRLSKSDFTEEFLSTLTTPEMAAAISSVSSFANEDEVQELLSKVSVSDLITLLRLNENVTEKNVLDLMSILLLPENIEEIFIGSYYRSDQTLLDLLVESYNNLK